VRTSARLHRLSIGHTEILVPFTLVEWVYDEYNKSVPNEALAEALVKAFSFSCCAVATGSDHPRGGGSKFLGYVEIAGYKAPGAAFK
jgi:hypothetical protein